MYRTKAAFATFYNYACFVSAMAVLVGTASAYAATCESGATRQFNKIAATAPLEAAIRAFASAKLKKRRYFEGDPKNCAAPRLDHPMYPGIPVRDCAYVEGGLHGWLRQANPSGEQISTWILNACSASSKKSHCVRTLAVNSWCSNQFSFPVVGNIIEPAYSAGGKGSGSLNLIFLHGVTIPRPEGIPSHEDVAPERQKQLLAPLADSTGAYSGAPNQVSRPSAIRQDIFVDFGSEPPTRPERRARVGDSCPPSARRNAWLQVSRDAFIKAWNTGHHPLFEAAARAVDAGLTDLAKKDCQGH